jgi:CubicO group peptidase (beta-lactamase class C family)
MKLTIQLLFLVLLFSTQYAFAENNQYQNKIEQFITTANKDNNFNGTVLVAKHGDILFHKSYGYADKHKKEPLTIEHRLSPGSIAKEFTTAIIMQLKMNGKLRYEDKISQYLTFLPEWANDISIENILTHTSGMPKVKWHANITTTDIIKQIGEIKTLEFKPNQDYLYTNLNVVLRALIVESIIRSPFKSHLKNTLFVPADMTSTFNKTAISPNTKLITFGDYPTAISGLTIYTTALDLYKWEKTLWGNKLIDREHLKKVIIEPGLSGNPHRAYFDFGTFTVNNKQRLTQLSHNGSNPSHHAIKYNDFDNDIIIILMSSDGRKATLYELKAAISKVFNT